MADRIIELERRINALENKTAAIHSTAPAATASSAPRQKSSDFPWQLIGARLEMHGRRIDIDHAINQASGISRSPRAPSRHPARRSRNLNAHALSATRNGRPFSPTAATSFCVPARSLRDAIAKEWEAECVVFGENDVGDSFDSDEVNPPRGTEIKIGLDSDLKEAFDNGISVLANGIAVLTQRVNALEAEVRSKS